MKAAEKRRNAVLWRVLRQIGLPAVLCLALCPTTAMTAGEDVDRLDIAPRPQTGQGTVQQEPVFVIPDAPGTTVVRPEGEPEVVAPMQPVEPGTLVPVVPQVVAPSGQEPKGVLPADRGPDVIVPVPTRPETALPEALKPDAVKPEDPRIVAPHAVTPGKRVDPALPDARRPGTAQPEKTTPVVPVQPGKTEPPKYYTPGDFLVVTPIPGAPETPAAREDGAKKPEPVKPEAKKPGPPPAKQETPPQTQQPPKIQPEKTRKPEKQPGRPAPPQEKKTPPASQPAPPPKAEGKPRSGEPLRIPPEAVKSGKLDFLEGCWVATRPEYYSKRTIRERWCFDRNGVGKRFIRDPKVADRCVGAARARLEGDVLHVGSEGAFCTAGVKWGASRMTCRGVGGKTPCSWVFTDANGGTQAYDIPFYRE